MGDEAADSFRAIGYIDYLGTNFQTQPIDWYKDQLLPFWTKLSFHDFPPLAMIIENLFFRIFGDSILVSKLPAVILGTLAVYLIYLIVRKLFREEDLALWAALLFAVESSMVWVFRRSFLEPFVVFFLLLSIYSFLLFLENRKKWWLFGASLGLLALTKYTGIFIIPVYFFYLFFISIFRTSEVLKIEKNIRTSDVHILKSWHLYAAFGLALLLFSPVIIYNIFLYKTTGHFDLQIAYFLGQETPEWTGLVGKIQAPFSDIGKNIFYLYSPLFLVVALAGLLLGIERIRKNKLVLPAALLPILYLFFAAMLLTKVGSAHRFLSLLGPGLMVFAALVLRFAWNKKNIFLRLLAAAFLIFEIGFSIQKNIIEVSDYGIAKLDHYFEEELGGKESAVIPESDSPHLNKIIYKFAGRKSETAPREFNLIIYNDNLALPTLQWIFYRRFFYHSTPTLFVENFSKSIGAQGEEYFKPFTIYFVQSTENTLLNDFKRDKTVGLDFEKLLQSKGFSVTRTIYGRDNLPMFRIYKFSI